MGMTLDKPTESQVLGGERALLLKRAQDAAAAGGGVGYGPWREPMPLGVTEYGGTSGLPVLNGAGLGHEPTLSESLGMGNRLSTVGPALIDPATGLDVPIAKVVKK